MKVKKIGYGAGTKDLEQPNVLRVFLGEADEIGNETIENHRFSGHRKSNGFSRAINVIETNIDNMNPEIYPYVIDKLMENDALDAYLTNIIMKKGRPAIKLAVLSRIEDTDKLMNIVFDETTTLGVRIYSATRKKLDREVKTINTKYGNVRVKISKDRNEIKNITPEYEDCVKIAKKRKIPLKKVYEEVRKLM